MNLSRTRWMAAAVLAGGALLAGSEALAVIGRPATPMSFAGVARRTTRRTMIVAGAAASSTPEEAAPAPAPRAAAPPGVPPPGALTSLPAGCAAGRPCGGVVYQPVYQGTTLYFVPEK